MRRLTRPLRSLRNSLCAVRWQQNPSGVRHLERWISEKARATPAGAIVLDAGSGLAPFRHHLAHTQYESADHLKNESSYHPPTYACDLSNIPVAARRFDRIMCTQVLEHVPDPEAVLREFSRVLKDDGEIWLSAPLFFEEHEGPQDFFRYTQWGFRRIGQQAGLEVEELEWLEGYHATLAHQLSMAAQELSTSHVTRVARWYDFVPLHLLVFALRIQFGLLARLFTMLDQREPDTRHGMCINYRMVLRKPHGEKRRDEEGTAQPA